MPDREFIIDMDQVYVQLEQDEREQQELLPHEPLRIVVEAPPNFDPEEHLPPELHRYIDYAWYAMFDAMLWQGAGRYDPGWELRTTYFLAPGFDDPNATSNRHEMTDEWLCAYVLATDDFYQFYLGSPLYSHLLGKLSDADKRLCEEILRSVRDALVEARVLRVHRP